MKAFVFKGGGKLWYWHIRSRNGQIRCDGSEGYSSKSNAIRAARGLIRDVQRIRFEGSNVEVVTLN